MPPLLIVALLSLLLGLQPLTTDLYLPALPALTAGLGASIAQAQLTLTALLLAFGSSQLVWGPLSDRFGRRPILLWGMGAYVLAAVGCAAAPDMEWLIVARAVQGAALGAAVMCARAIVRDLYAPTEGMRIMSKGQSGLGVLACISAPLGGLLADWMGWRAALLALGVFGAVAFTLVLLRFEETVPRHGRQPLRPGPLLRTWRTILVHPTFWAFSLLTAASYGGLFTFLATSSFVFIQELGLTRTQYGLVMFTMPMTYILGTIACRRLLPRLGPRRTVALAGGLSLLGGALMGALAWAGLRSSWAIMLPFYIFMLAHGVHQPSGQSGAIGPFPQAAGAASALNGFLMMVVAFAMGSWLSTHAQLSASLLAAGVCFWGVLTALAAWTLVQKHGHAREH